ncbi:Chemotaxis regulator - transmits chemoreceptor signals to flagelllar motor components CheY [Labilithrix luteola]|uniref:histidine kinase n=1 Tax=Labilithrix luteola TaxID=1391654 RepID=A0A0K1PMX2_9BACT|nr:GAF domain-containing protein [Labilithrix luteola]AKU94736.1 Chemotaxis regulator - transmits chemoreceptor signals to flagelllar motor components CheY [Labilithrix luteola]
MQSFDTHRDFDLQRELDSLLSAIVDVRPGEGERVRVLRLVDAFPLAAVLIDGHEVVAESASARRMRKVVATDEESVQPAPWILVRDGVRRGLSDWAFEREHAAALEFEKVLLERNDGSCVWTFATALSVPSRQDARRRAICLFSNRAPSTFGGVSTTQAAHRRAAFLVQASTKLLSTPLDAGELLRQLGALAVPAVADACSIHLVDERLGELRLVAGSWASPEKEAIAREIMSGYPQATKRWLAIANALASSRCELCTEITDSMLRAIALDESHLDLLRRRGASSTIAAPLRVKRRVIGLLVLITDDSSGRTYDAADLDMVEQLAINGGLAVESARLYQREQLARAVVERAANRMRRLQEIMSDLASALTCDDIARAVIDHGLAAVGADRGGIWMLDEATNVLRLVNAAAPAADREALAQIAVDAPGIHAPFVDTMRHAQPYFIDSRAEFERLYPEAAKFYGDVASFSLLPLIVQGRVVGLLSFAFTSDRPFDAGERAFLLLVADHCAQGLSRARTYEAEQRARSEMALLYGLVDAVNRATNIEEVFQPALDVVTRAFGVSRSSILLFDQDGVLHFKAWRGLSETYRRAVEANARWPRTSNDPTPPFVTDVEVDSSLASYRDDFRKEGIRALALFPLAHYGRVLGKLVVYSDKPRTFSQDDVQLGLTIAAQVSQALVRKFAEVEAETARMSAEYASRMKDEFLAVVSHELRTPLSSIMGWASILRTDRRNDPNTLAKGLDVIERNAKAQTTIIEDILDVSRIIRGKLQLDVHPVKLTTVVAEAIESLRTSATAKEITVTLEADDEAAVLIGDPERLRQIAWNLLSNAIKFTPAKGQVSARVVREEGALLLEVSDTGVGIPSDFLPFVFDRFRQADSSTTRRQGGLGLGLSIVRHLAELHGGQVTVKSEGTGKGATFVARFPVRAPVERTASEQVATAQHLSAGTNGKPANDERVDLTGVRVLVVDDQVDARDVTKEALETSGAEVVLASTVTEAVELARAFAPMVLVTDIGMPDEDGFSLLRRVRELPGSIARIPAVALTAYARAEDTTKVEKAGFAVCVTKPARREVIVQAVFRALCI